MHRFEDHGGTVPENSLVLLGRSGSSIAVTAVGETAAISAEEGLRNEEREMQRQNQASEGRARIRVDYLEATTSSCSMSSNYGMSRSSFTGRE